MKLFQNIFYKKKTFEFKTLINSEKHDPDKKTIVFLSGSIPTYDKDSGSNRLKEIILAYLKLGYNCIISVGKTVDDEKYIDYFNEIGAILFLENKELQKEISFLESIPKVEYVWYYGPNTLKNNFKRISKTLPQSKSIYDMVDIHFLRYKRAIELEPKKYSLKKRYNKYFKIETVLAKKIDLVIAISEQEKKVMSSYLNSDKIITISNIHYPKVDIKDTPAFEDRKNILFIGSAHTPNIDALHFLYKEIMPLVWARLPELKVDIIGNLDKVISDINHPNIIFHGYVPEIESFFKSTKFMIAPLRFGAGVKGKIGQSFEYYLPLITTEIGAEGMFLNHKENALLANSPEEFAIEIINLYNNKTLWETLQGNSEISLKPFSREILKETLKSI